MSGKKSDDYLLGVNQLELDRLRFQHSVWKEETDKFLDKLNVQKGWKVLDAGSGPGFVSFDMRERVGDTGEITALEPSEMYLDYFKDESGKKGWENIKTVNGTVENAGLPKNYYDLIFSRWVIGFVPDPELFIARLVSSLAPGGILALQDYAFHGLYLYPRGGAYEKFAPAAEKYWQSMGGDLRIAVRVPSIFKENKLELAHYQPVALAGAPGSGVFEWHHYFLTQHVPVMVEKNILNKDDGDGIIKDWLSHRENPDSLFFSPPVVNMAGRKK